MIPGGSSLPVLTPTRSTRRSTRTRSARSGLFLGSGVVIVIDDRTLHRAARPAGRAVLHARVVRQVHAVPRGHALDRPDPASRSRTARATQYELDLLLDVCDRIIGKCLCALGDAAAMPVASYVTKFRDEFQAHVDAWRLPVRRRLAARRPLRARSTSTRTPPVPPRCPRERAELVRVTIDGRRCRCRRARGSSRRRSPPGSRSPSSATSRASGRRRRLPHVPRRDRGHAEAAGRLHADRAGRHGRQDRADVGEGGRGAERDARVHPRQPPARLPRLRQGRRVPAPGPHVPLRARLTRMRSTKRTFEKPIPISPTIALDRERCILCYRCTRFCEEVARTGS